MTVLPVTAAASTGGAAVDNVIAVALQSTT
jgi:hypothetical protein